MCGIVGFSGTSDAIAKIIKGLKVLEYRGYDSVGLAMGDDNGIRIIKCRGRVDALRDKIKAENFQSASCGIGHTRWATHGGPSDINSHPHKTDVLALVHNGIIENYRELKSQLPKCGKEVISETDTEVAAWVISEEYKACRDPLMAILNSTKKFSGSYAFQIIFDDYADEIFAIRKDSPLIIGKGVDGSYLASDMTALLPFTNLFCYPKDGELVHITKTDVTLSTADNEYEPTWQKTDITLEAAEKNGYPHFMLKEIHEQSEAFFKTVRPRINNGIPDFSSDGISDELLQSIENIHIVGCGSAMHAGLVGKHLIEHLARIPVTVEIASEFRYNEPIINEKSLIITVSQSGETADTLAALRYAKKQGAFTISIVNVVGSSIAREADATIYTYAGPEIAVATTKGYCVQIAIFMLFASKLAHLRGKIIDVTVKEFCSCISETIPKVIEQTFLLHEKIKEIAKSFFDNENIFYIGRGIDQALCVEGSLKLKEISYIHSEAYAAGELKHGTISLISKGTPVIALSTSEILYDKTVSNIRECSSRGAEVLFICHSEAKEPESIASKVLRLPKCGKYTGILSAAVVMQLLAYEIAALRGCDIDKPRNLAKSVTVE